MGYCKEAGWQYIDAYQRWIIFYKVKEECCRISQQKKKKLDNAFAVRKDDLKFARIVLPLSAIYIINSVLLNPNIFELLEYRNLTIELGWFLFILSPFFLYFHDKKIYQLLRSKYESTGELYLGNPNKKQMYFQPRSLFLFRIYDCYFYSIFKILLWPFDKSIDWCCCVLCVFLLAKILL